MNKFFKIAIATAALTLGTAGFAAAGCWGCSGGQQQTPQQPVLQMDLKMNWTGQVQGQGFAFGDKEGVVESSTVDSYNAWGGGSIKVDPNCGAGCGDQVLFSGFDANQLAKGNTYAKSVGTGGVTAQSGSAAMGEFTFGSKLDFSTK